MNDDRHREAASGAMLAFAVGDALGWPQETRGNRVGGTRDLRPELVLREWIRREGGGYAPHQEVMPVGVYSDDTQLTLAVARSLRHDRWWEYLTEVELPWWGQYGLGGGGATKRAAQSWAKQKPPWVPSGAKGYWTAGGNGAAMRVLAHCTRADEPFTPVRRRVLADGAATHGDPIALVGAQLYAYAVWTTMRRREPLGWGQLLEETLDGKDQWAELDPGAAPSSWASHLESDYFERWARTVEDAIQLLSRARDEMAHGALAIDERVLEDLGCLSAVGGTGTITATGALYLASRHASNPEHGLVRAAFARGADTDTLAAMTGAILGAVHGPSWLGQAADDVMDADLLRHVLDDSRAADKSAPYARSSQRYVEALLARARPATRGHLPFYGESYIIEIRDLDNRMSRIRSWWFRNTAGQTFRVKRISRAKHQPWVELPGISDAQHESEPDPQHEPKPVAERPNGQMRSGLVVRVSDIDRARTFYESIIGLSVSRETRSSIVLGGWLALERAGFEEDLGQASIGFTSVLPLAVTLYAHEGQFEAVQQRLDQSHVDFKIYRAGRGPTVRTTDPDGTPVEIRLAP